MNEQLLKELNKVCSAQIPPDLFLQSQLDDDLRNLMDYLGNKYHGINIDPKKENKIKEIGYYIDLGFDDWFKKRLNHYREKGKEMGMGIPMKRDKEAEERECMKTFLIHRGENINDWDILKPERDEIVDIGAKNKKNKCRIQAQVRFLQDREVGELGARKFTTGEQTPESFSRLVFGAIQDKSKYQLESTQEVYLLLNSIFDVPDFLVSELKNRLSTQNFLHWKEIYIVCSEKNIKVK